MCIQQYLVSISSPSSEGGGLIEINPGNAILIRVSISSPSSEGGGHYADMAEKLGIEFPLVLLQAKVVGSRV